MNKKIKLKNQEVEYKLKISNRARYLRLAIDSSGSLTVTKPRLLPSIFVTNFLVRKADWVLKRIEGKKDAIPISKDDYLLKKQAAKKFVTEKVKYFNKFYNFEYKKINIRNQKTRWGSCSSKANLSFSYRIVDLPEKLADYIVVHELCHLKEFNHSKSFWNLVAETIPDHKEIRRDLKTKY